MSDTTPAPPADLTGRSLDFWNYAVTTFDPSEAERELLVEACRTMGNLDLLAAAISEHGALVVGSQGQPVINSALTEARGQRIVLHRLIAALGFEDDDEPAVPTVAAMRARKAADTRWSGHRRDVADRMAAGVE